MPDDIIRIPGGSKSRSLIQLIEAGHYVDLTTGRVLKRHVSGRVVADFGELPVSRAEGLFLFEPHKPAPAGEAPQTVQWITWGTWTAAASQPPITSFRTTWVVPPPPKTQNNQLIYLFNGMQNGAWIYQPVLQWGGASTDPGGGNYWTVASWFVSGNIAFYSPEAKVQPGQVLVGVMTLSGQSGGANPTFDYECAFQNLPETSLPIRGVQQLTNCVETLEAYDNTGNNPPANCSDYPFVNKTAFAAIEIRSANAEMAVTWSPQNRISGCGQHAVIVSNASPGGEVDLYYNNPAAPAPPSRDRLLANEGLLVNQSMYSLDQRFKLILQGDGNLVLYGPNSQPLWATNTNGKPEVFRAIMQADGNFVLYDVLGAAVWASNTVGNAGAYLVQQNDGNLVIYNAANHAIWASNSVVPAQPAAPTQTGRLLVNQGLMASHSLASADGRFQLIQQLDGNLVLYGPNHQALWASNTNGHADIWDVVMQGDGNLVVYDAHGHPLWASNTNGNPGATFIIQDDGNAVVYNTAGHALWASNTVVKEQPAPPTLPGQLLVGQGLMATKSIRSADGRFQFILQGDSNLVLYGPERQVLWAANSQGHPSVWDLIMQGDGNLVVYDATGHPIWASNTVGHPGATFVVQNDGNAVIYDVNHRAVWATNSVVPVRPGGATHKDRLLPGQCLAPGQQITSLDGRFRLILQGDGNLVLYGPPPGNVPLWSSRTNGHGNIWDAVLQTDGNFVVYDTGGRPLWASGTNGKPVEWLVLQNDANLVLYDTGGHALWASGTNLPPQPSAPTKGDRLLPGQGLIGGQSIKSADGRFTFILQTDANLVLYAPGNRPLWASKTNGHTVYPWFVAMQTDGNLVIYDSEGKAFWASNTNGNPGAWVVAQSDGNVVIYNAANHPLWATNTVQ